jgi:carboxypeptidase family protein
MRRGATMMLAGVLLFAATARSAGAQDVAGALEGTILGSGFQPVSEADVVASGPSLQQPATAHSTARGSFKMLSLPVGTYLVRIRAIGYRPVLYQRVVVSLGRTTSLGTLTLEPQAFDLAEIVVSAEVSPIDLTTASSGTNLRAAQLDGLPLDRSLNSIIALAPQATRQAKDLAFRSEGVNIAGGSVWDNAYFVDGVNVTDPGSGASGINLPYNFVQEVQIKTGGYEAEFGRALGGIVNVVTPSGGNDFHGDVFSFFSADELRAHPRYGLSQPNLDNFTQFDVGGSLGGPLVRDRLWFFGAYNPILDTRDASFPGISVKKDRQVQHRFAGKLTWQPSASTRVVLSSTGDPTVHDGVVPNPDFGAATSVLNPEAVLGILNQGGFGFSLRTDHVTTSGVLLAMTISRSAYRDDQKPQTSLGASQPRLTDAEGSWSGGYGGSSLSHLGRMAAQASATVPFSAHTLKAGVEYESNTLDQRSDQGEGQRGGFLFQLPGEDGRYAWYRAQNVADVANRILSTYVQDSWESSPRLRLNAGLRWEGQWWIGAKGKIAQSILDQVAPRLGVVFSPGRLGSQKLFASAGRFYEQVPVEAMSLFYGTGGFSVTVYPQDPRTDTTGAFIFTAFPFGAVSRVAGLRGEYFDEVTLGYERHVGSGLKVGVRAIMRALRSVIEDTFRADGSEVLGNPGRGALDSFPMPNHRYEALEMTFQRVGAGHFQFLASYVLSKNRGNYPGLYAGDGQAPNGSSQFDSRDSLAISTGPLPGSRTHILKAFGSYRFGFGLTAGTSAYWQSGTPLNEFGITPSGSAAFLQPRGSAGRTPSTWDLNLRLDYPVPRSVLHALGLRLILDLEHIGSPRRPIAFSQQHYLGEDSQGNPTDPSPLYGQVNVYDPPMSARFGVDLGF